MSVIDEVEAFRKHNEEADDAAPLEKTKEPDNKPDPAEVIAINSEQATVTVQNTLQHAMESKVQDGKQDIKELARDLTYLKGASDLQADETFKQDYQDELAKQMIRDLQDEGKRAAIQQTAKKAEEKNIRNQAFYDGYAPLFELLGIKKAYGLIPMIVTVVVVMIPFLILSFARFIFNGLNSLFEAISKFVKPAFWLCTTLLIIAITVAGLVGLMALSDLIFGTQIISALKSIS